MEFLKRRPILATLGGLATLEWAGLIGVYFSMSPVKQMDLQMSPTMILWFGVGSVVVFAGLLTILFASTVRPLRPCVPLIVGALLVFVVISGILVPAIAAHPACECEQS